MHWSSCHLVILSRKPWDDYLLLRPLVVWLGRSVKVAVQMWRIAIEIKAELLIVRVAKLAQGNGSRDIRKPYASASKRHFELLRFSLYERKTKHPKQ